MQPKVTLQRSVIALVAAVFLTSVWVPAVSAPGGNDVVWFSDHKQIKAIDAETNQVARLVRLRKEPRGLTVDPANGSLWVLGHDDLTRFNASGTEVLNIELRRLEHRFDHPKSLALNPYTGSLWVAGEHQVLHISSEGNRLAQWRAPNDIKALDLDLDESVWLLSEHRLFHLSPSAQLLTSTELRRRHSDHDRGKRDDDNGDDDKKGGEDDNGHNYEGKLLRVDGLGGIIWVATQKRLLKFDLNDLNKDPPSHRAAQAAGQAPRRRPTDRRAGRSSRFRNTLGSDFPKPDPVRPDRESYKNG